jgi:hypothetical protein
VLYRLSGEIFQMYCDVSINSTSICCNGTAASDGYENYRVAGDYILYVILMRFVWGTR